jgi:hypothetical protein
MTAICLGVLLTMLSWSTSGIGGEKATEEFEEYKEFKNRSQEPNPGFRPKACARATGSWILIPILELLVLLELLDHFSTFEYRRLQIRQDGQKITAGLSSLAIRLTSYGSHYPRGRAV